MFSQLLLDYSTSQLLSTTLKLSGSPHIIEQGAKSYALNGLPKLLSVTGDVKKPILLEASLHNYTFQNLIDEIGAQDIFAAEVGGCTEPIIFKGNSERNLDLDKECLMQLVHVFYLIQREILQKFMKVNFTLWQKKAANNVYLAEKDL